MRKGQRIGPYFQLSFYPLAQSISIKDVPGKNAITVCEVKFGAKILPRCTVFLT